MGGSCSRSLAGCLKAEDRPDAEIETSIGLEQAYAASLLDINKHIPASLQAACEKLVPFVPKRVQSAFVSGVYNHESTGSVRMPPKPRPFQGAVLLVDISGFTKLSEAFSRLGTEGCEEFSTLVSRYLGIMSDIIAKHHGDIDCFAGDALLVIFSGVPRAQQKQKQQRHAYMKAVIGALRPKEGDLGEAVQLAFNCITDICKELNGVRISPGSPSLSIHGALAAGNLHAVECGGAENGRSEAFVIGEPLCELGTAMPVAGESELAIAPSALSILDGLVMCNDGRFKGDCKCVPLPEAQDRADGIPHTFNLGSHSFERKSTISSAETVAKMASDLVKLEEAERGKAKRKGGEKLRDASWMARMSQRKFALRAEKSEANMSQRAAGSGLGLDALLLFVPSFVRERCIEGMELESLSEHRRVCVLFVVAQLKKQDVVRTGYIQKLQGLLGQAIQVASTFGGVTRQITVDDKGLAAIFVFGLPGSGHGHGNMGVICVQASMQITEIMHDGGIPCNAGIDLGPCYCGLVGVRSGRCEYTVMGDTVNTAARMAAKARKRGDRILCSDSVRSMISGSHAEEQSILLTQAGSELLKGKPGPVPVFIPELSMSVKTSVVASADVVGRADVLARLEVFVQSRFLPGLREGGPGLLVLDGPVGMGKSMLLSVMQRSIIPRHERNKGMRMPVIALRAVAGHSSFHMCHELLQCLLSLHGVSNAGFYSCLEAEHFQHLQMGDIPALLVPVLLGIHDAHSLPPHRKVAAFQEMYANVFRAALACSTPALLVVSGAEIMDRTSLAILFHILHVDIQSVPARHAGFEHHGSGGIILITNKRLSFHPVQDPDGTALEFTNTTRDITYIPLQPLSRAEVEQVAIQVLGCSAVRDDLLGVLIDQTQGVPGYVVELCRWMLDKCMLDTDREDTTGLRKGIAAADFKAASLQNIIFSSIDQLPFKQAMLLRLASILGMQFDPDLLYELAGEEMKLAKKDLVQHMQGLLFSGWLTDSGGTLQFAQQIAQDVCYNAMLHRHRRRLHSKTGMLLRRKLGLDENLPDDAVTVDLVKNHERVARHMWAAIKGRITARDAKERVTVDELRGFVTSAIWISRRSIFFGDCTGWSDGWQEKLRECIQPETFRPEQRSWIEAQLEVANGCMQRELLNNLVFRDNGQQRASTGLDDLNLTISRLNHQLDQQRDKPNRNLTSLVSGRHKGRLERSPLYYPVRTIGFCASVAMQYQMKGYITLDNWRKLCSGFETVNSLDEQLVYLAMITPMGLFGSRYQEVGMYAEKAYQAFEAAGRPHVKVPFPAGVDVCLMWGRYAGQVMQGELDDPSTASRIERDMERQVHEQGLAVRFQIRCIESNWEPHYSQRVSTWTKKLDLFIAAHGSKATKPHVLRYLEDIEAAHSQSIRLAGHMRQDSSVGEPCAAASVEMKEALATWVRATSAAITGVEKSAVRQDVQPLAVTLVYEGCRVVFPPPGSELECSRVRLTTDIGVQYFQEVVAALSKVTQHWAKKYMYEGQIFCRLPGALIWAKAMLSWFQCLLLWPAEKLSQVVDDPRLESGVRGWPRGPQLAPGLKCVCSRLLMAQAVSTGDPRFPETLAGLLPATLALARLLMGHGNLTSSARSPGRSSFLAWQAQAVFVPNEAPQQAVLGGGPPSYISVQRVELGSAAAVAVALAHLRGVVSRIKIAGEMIHPDNVQAKADVGYSETLWSAVMLYNSAKAMTVAA